MQNQAPAVAVVVTHDVSNFETWKQLFDRHADKRKSAGVVQVHVNRHVEAPERLTVYLAGASAEELEAFLSSADLAATMRDAGVKGPPHIALITPVEDRTVKDRPLAGVIVKHEVTDFAVWKRAFDAHSSARTAGGIVGHAVNRAAKDPNLVVVYLQAESLEALRAFTGSEDLKRSMDAAGVVGKPELTFVNGGEWTN